MDLPKDLWKNQIVTLGRVPGISTRYRPALQTLGRPFAIRETEGGAAECMFGQQRDEETPRARGPILIKSPLR